MVLKEGKIGENGWNSKSSYNRTGGSGGSESYVKIIKDNKVETLISARGGAGGKSSDGKGGWYGSGSNINTGYNAIAKTNDQKEGFVKIKRIK